MRSDFNLLTQAMSEVTYCCYLCCGRQVVLWYRFRDSVVLLLQLAVPESQ
jgi:hypothetical protein